MDERVLQLKELKAEYKKCRAKAGWINKCFAWIFGVATAIVAVMTVFVLFNDAPWVQFVDTNLWEPFKAAVALGIDYAAGWRLTQQYGLYALIVGFVLTAIFDVLGYIASEKVKTTEIYLNYRALKLTLEAEKEEK